MDSENATKNFAECDIDDLNPTVLLSNSGKQAGEVVFEFEEDVADGSESDHRKRFRFICYFASGGVGKLSKAKDVVFDRLVAVKSLKEVHSENPKAVKAFLDECRLNAQLDHPSIVPVYSIGKGEGGVWEVVMKLIHGSSLSEFINIARAAYDKKKVTYRLEQYALASRLEYFLKICEVIGYCHSRKIVHGDLKPDNVMMGQYGEVYIMDWGCARPVGSVPDFVSGTPNYLPPEFFEEHRATPLVDIYALGVILFEMTTLLRGRTGNSTGRNTGNVTRHNIHEPEQWHYQKDLKVAPALRAVIAKAINPNPRQRYQSVGDLANDVRHFIYNEEVSAFPDNLFRQGIRWISNNQMKSVLAAMLFIAVLCGLLFYSFYHSTRMEEQNQIALTQRIKFQSYTDELAGAVERNLFATQAQILLFADNLIEYSQRRPDHSQKFYDNTDYRSPDTAPAGMRKTEYYFSPINLDHPVRFPAGVETGRMIGAKQFLHICRKVIDADFEASDLHSGSKEYLISPGCRVQRLFVSWANGVEYCYPGSYDDPEARAYQWRWGDPANRSRERRIVWSQPYQANIEAHRMTCRYPIFSSGDEYLGIAAIELRLEKIFEPWIRAQKADPVHKFYYVGALRERVVAVSGGKLLLLERGKAFPDGSTVDEILEIAARLEKNRFKQFQASAGGASHFVSGTPLKIAGGLSMQLIETEVMKNHHHEE